MCLGIILSFSLQPVSLELDSGPRVAALIRSAVLPHPGQMEAHAQKHLVIFRCRVLGYDSGSGVWAVRLTHCCFSAA